MRLYYHEPLDKDSVPAPGDFTVSGATVQWVAIEANAVVLTLAEAVTAGATRTLTYTKGAYPVRDAAGNEAAAISSKTLNAALASDSDAPKPTVGVGDTDWGRGDADLRQGARPAVDAGGLGVRDLASAHLVGSGPTRDLGQGRRGAHGGVSPCRSRGRMSCWA